MTVASRALGEGGGMGRDVRNVTVDPCGDVPHDGSRSWCRVVSDVPARDVVRFPAHVRVAPPDRARRRRTLPRFRILPAPFTRCSCAPGGPPHGRRAGKSI